MRSLMAVANLPRRRVLAAAALSGATSLSHVVTMAAVGGLLAWSAARPGLAAVGGLLILVELLSFLRAPVRFADRLSGHRVAFDALTAWRPWLFRKLIPLAPAGLWRRRSGDLLARAIGDVDLLQDLYVRIAVPLGGAVAALLVTAICLGVLIPPLGLLTLVASGIVLAAAALGHRRGARAAEELLQLNGELAATISDALLGAELLTVARAWAPTVTRVVDLRARVATLHQVAERAVGRRRLVAEGVVAGLILAALVLGEQWHRHHGLSGPWTAAAIFAAIATADAVATIVAAASAVDPVLAAANRLGELPSGPATPDHPRAVATTPHHLAIEDGAFRYPGATVDAFTAFSLDVAASSRVAVTGPSGSGKTSVLLALCGLWPLASGELTIDGLPATSVDLYQYRTTLGVHLASTTLFAGTVRSNLDTLGTATTEALLEGLASLGLPATLEFLEREVGERGRSLSGGERQRLSVLRALLMARGALILDEPTAELDGASASLTWDAISDTRTTVVLATHDAPPIPSVTSVSVASVLRTTE